MTFIVINAEEARVVVAATDRVEIRDTEGHHIGYVAHGFTPDEIAEARHRLDSGGPWYTTQQVVDQIQSLSSD